MQSYYFTMNDVANDLGYGRPDPVTGQKPMQAGLIAQELREIEPNLVIPSFDNPDYYTINYGNLNAILVEAIKELNVRAENARVALGVAAPTTTTTTMATTTTTTTVVPPAYNTLTATPTIGTEGHTVTFTLNTTSIPDNTLVAFTISGTVTRADIEGRGMHTILPTGTTENVGLGLFRVVNNQATFTFDLIPDNETEPVESIAITLVEDDEHGNSTGRLSAVAQVQDA